MKKIFLITVALTMLTVSCKKESFFALERPPQSPWNDVTEFERSIIGAYSICFETPGGWQNSWVVAKLFKNMVADDMATSTPGDASWGWYRDTENNNKQIHNATWPLFYQTIAICNDALDFVAAHNGDPYPDMSADDRNYNFNRIVGELYFVRGYCYYTLATIFGDAYVPNGANDGKQLPLVTTFASTVTDAVKPPMGTTAQIWDQILGDLKKSYDLLPEQYIAGKMHPSYSAGRGNKFAAAAMLSRAYLYMGDYANANTYADYVITQNGGAYDLSEDPIQAFNKSDLSAGRESIMWIPFYDVTLDSPPWFASVFSQLSGDSPCPWSASVVDYGTLQRLGWMPDPKNDTTITNVARRDKRFQQLFYVREPANVPVADQVPGRYYETRPNLTFRTVLDNKYFRGPGLRYSNYPEIRLAEMYLNRSICQFKAGNKPGAADDLNVIRKRAWDASAAGVAYESSTSFVTAANITEQTINDERVIEMFGEGDRIDYLRGLKEDVGNGDRGPGSVPYTDKGFVWIAPQGELDYNQSMH